MRFARVRPLAAGFALLVLALVLVRVELHARHRLLQPGDAIVPMQLLTLDGIPARLNPSGRPTVINVFATWCGPCRAEMPAFAGLARQLQRRGTLVIGIDQQEGGAQVSAFAHEFAIPYRLYIDPGTFTHDVLGARMIPNTMYVDAHGIIRWQHAGPLTPQDFALLARSAG